VSEFATATWRCDGSGCSEAVAIRYHLPTDGHPPDEAPEPWVSEQRHGRWFYYCPKCGAPEVSSDFEENTLSVCDLEAERTYRKEHLCYRCVHCAVCRFAPNDEGQRLFVTVSRCREWVPSPID